MENPKIIFGDENFLVVDKPSGLEVASIVEKDEPTLVDWLVKKYPAIAKVGPDPARPGIVHRLDKSASGLLVIAKTEAAFENLSSQFKMRRVEKEYLVLVYGKPPEEEGEIVFPLARAKSGRFAALPIGSEAGRQAITEYEVLEHFKNFSLLKVKIKTGRTHQIRVHLFALGCPVVGDKLYRQKKIKNQPAVRLFLHAARLKFHGQNSELFEFESELPRDLSDFLETLG